MNDDLDPTTEALVKELSLRNMVRTAVLSLVPRKRILEQMTLVTKGAFPREHLESLVDTQISEVQVEAERVREDLLKTSMLFASEMMGNPMTDPKERKDWFDRRLKVAEMGETAAKVDVQIVFAPPTPEQQAEFDKFMQDRA